MGGTNETTMRNSTFRPSEDKSKVDLAKHPRFESVRLITLKGVNNFELEIDQAVANQTEVEKWNAAKAKLTGSDSLFFPSSYTFKKTQFCGSSGICTLRFPDFRHFLSNEIVDRSLDTNNFQETEFWYLVYGLLQGTSYCHDRGLKSGDLRPLNVYISDSGEVCIGTQFTFPQEQTNYFKTAFEHETTYLSPEELKDIKAGKNEGIDGYELSDSFSLGLTLLDAALLEDSYGLYLKDGSLDQNKLDRRIQKCRASNYSQPLKLLIECLCSVEPSKRISCRQLLEWLENYRDEISFIDNFVVKALPEKMFKLKEEIAVRSPKQLQSANRQSSLQEGDRKQLRSSSPGQNYSPNQFVAQQKSTPQQMSIAQQQFAPQQQFQASPQYFNQVYPPPTQFQGQPQFQMQANFSPMQLQTSQGQFSVPQGMQFNQQPRLSIPQTQIFEQIAPRISNMSYQHQFQGQPILVEDQQNVFVRAVSPAPRVSTSSMQPMQFQQVSLPVGSPRMSNGNVMFPSNGGSRRVSSVPMAPQVEYRRPSQERNSFQKEEVLFTQQLNSPVGAPRMSNGNVMFPSDGGNRRVASVQMAPQVEYRRPSQERNFFQKEEVSVSQNYYQPQSVPTPNPILNRGKSPSQNRASIPTPSQRIQSLPQFKNITKIDSSMHETQMVEISSHPQLSEQQAMNMQYQYPPQRVQEEDDSSPQQQSRSSQQSKNHQQSVAAQQAYQREQEMLRQIYQQGQAKRQSQAQQPSQRTSQQRTSQQQSQRYSQDQQQFKSKKSQQSQQQQSQQVVLPQQSKQQFVGDSQMDVVQNSHNSFGQQQSSSFKTVSDSDWQDRQVQAGKNSSVNQQSSVFRSNDHIPGLPQQFSLNSGPQQTSIYKNMDSKLVSNAQIFVSQGQLDAKYYEEHQEDPAEQDVELEENDSNHYVYQVSQEKKSNYSNFYGMDQDDYKFDALGKQLEISRKMFPE